MRLSYETGTLMSERPGLSFVGWWAAGWISLPGYERLGPDWYWYPAPLAEWDGTIKKRTAPSAWRQSSSTVRGKTGGRRHRLTNYPRVNYNDVSGSDTVISVDGTMTYTTIQSQSRDALRRAVLDAATRLLVEHGLAGLSLRRVATEVGCSTTVIYTLFGGKDGLVDALWLEGFDRLFRAESDALAIADPLERLGALGRAYRRHALDNSDYYQVMFGGAVPGFRPSDPSLGRSRRTFQVLVDAVRDCMDAGVFRQEDPHLVATVLWATVHGAVSLELAGGFREGEGEAVFARATRAVAAGLMAPGAIPASVESVSGVEEQS